MYVLVFLCVVLRMMAYAQAAAQYFIVAPNVIRVDVEETILVNVLGIADGVRIPVTLYFQLTGSDQRISETTVSVTKDAPQEATLRIGRDQLPESREQQFITLVASANTAQLQFQDRRTILLSYQAGFVFIQTDKPLYTPSQRVDIRVVALDQEMAPANHKLQVDIANPDQIIVHRYNRAPVTGFLTLQFDFPPLPMFGNWTVIAYYGHQFKAKTSVQFEVREYVLPKFSVDVDTNTKYIVPETFNLISTVTARYVFGEPVSGNFFVSYGVFEDDGSLTILQEKEGQLNDQGKGFQDMVMPDVAVGDWAETLMGKRLLIQAFVTDRASGETVSVNNTMVAFSTTPYKFNWDLTLRYFKKGLPFAVKANVQFMNGLPAVGIPVTATATAQLPVGIRELEGAQNDQDARDRISGSQGEVDFRLDVPSDATAVTIRLETKDPDLIAANTHSTFTVQPQQSVSGEFLVVRIPSGEDRQTQMIGSQTSIEVHLTHPQNVETLYYFVIAGGRIVHTGTKQLVNLNTALGFFITHEMAPSSRVVAYYASTAANRPIIVDALLIDVEERCENPIGLSFKDLPKDDDTFKTDGSNKNIELRVEAKAGTTVGLLAVDEAIFTLRNYHRLTQKKVFKRMAGYDLGCGPGGGQTSATIFKDAGVTVMTNGGLDVAVREGLGCPSDAVRVRRSVNDTEREQLLNNYEGIEREYCEKGMRKLVNPEGNTCATRAKQLAKRQRINQESPEITAFFQCCREFEIISLGRSNDGDEGGVNLDHIMVRCNFPESWMFNEVVTDVNNFVRHQATLPDTVTTWVIEAVGVSEDYDMCVADPIKLKVRPPFFLDIGMPYSVQRDEQIEIIATVFNYADTALQVTVYLKGVDGLCSEAQPGSYSNGKTINVQPKKPASVKFVIVPLAIKRLPIEIAAVTNSSGHYRDAIRKFLTVRPEGYEQRDIVTGTLDPENVRRSPRNIVEGGLNQSYQHTQFWGDQGETKQVDIIRYELNGEAIPGTHQVHVSLMGDVLGNVIDTVIGGLDKLLRIPSGCGEQTMLGLAPNVYVYTYLQRSGQISAALETSAEKYISAGVKHELTFRKPDGSFTVWPTDKYGSSTWLTAFVIKVMCRAKDFTYIDDNIICKATEWLITQTHTDPADGSFTELYKVHHREMTGGVQGKVSLTAFVLISLLECECDTVNKDESVAAATAFLELELPALTRPYAIAITAYALAMANSINAEDAIVKLKDIAQYDAATDTRYWRSDDSSFGAGTKPYWYSKRPKAIEVETTSYALLALLEMEEIEYTHVIVNWLTNQENYNGGFVSTQDTVLGLQALSEYADRVQQYNIDMKCKATCQESDFSENFIMQADNAIVRQYARVVIPDSSPEFSVYFDTQGSGMGQFKFESTYYIPEADNSDCDFQLDINDEDVQNGKKDGKEFTYDIKVRYLRGEATGMAIVDVGLYTGYEPVIADLKNLKDNSNGRIQRFEVTDRSVVFYLEEIQQAELTRLTFSAERVFNVGKAQPVAVRVYDYYNPTEECVKFINPSQGSNMLSTLCTGDTCVCAAGKCARNPYNKFPDFNAGDMKDRACQSTSHFAYEVRVDGWMEKGSFQYYNMTILAPLKLGTDVVNRYDKRTFWKSKNCDTPVIKKSNYLVIGSGGLPTKDKMGNPMYKYIIDDRMSLYEWPTAKKINRLKKWKNINKILQELKMDLINGNGCAT